jgi:mRNA-degrading endonuclease YafQ of YafQ-DinJ toxin-antitoxin module
MELVWRDSFTQALQRKIKKGIPVRESICGRESVPGRESVGQTLRLLAADPFHHSLHSYKLKKNFEGAWACTAGHNLKIIFEFAQHPESGEQEILLLAVGTHDEVY